MNSNRSSLCVAITILISLFLFAHTKADSISPTIDFHAFESSYAGKRVCCPKFKDTTQLVIHLFTGMLSEYTHNEFVTVLERDSFPVLYVDTIHTDDLLEYAIVITPRKFKKLFNGKLVHNSVPASSFNGYTCQAYVRDYTIPGRYREFIQFIRFPDPQYYGYYYYDSERFEMKNQ